ncbi:MAG: deoxyuridine 5'-triphosphate nucleotidohydrolase [Clostridiales bacterium]|nr:deoxyuridine 5'-triphosphate nucleotidohydrolase [Clostridiales bacterium]
MSRFEKVTFEQWKADCGINGLDDKTLREWFDAIKLPRQATAASAGCDFFMPFNLNFEGGSSFRIATGARWVCDRSGGDRDKVLLIVPRSGLGFKYGIRLSNTVGVIDADYCDSDNEGHIIISLVNPSDRAVMLDEGKPFAQGIVVRYEVPEGAGSEDARNGGFGSTDK